MATATPASDPAGFAGLSAAEVAEAKDLATQLSHDLIDRKSVV